MPNSDDKKFNVNLDYIGRTYSILMGTIITSVVGVLIGGIFERITVPTLIFFEGVFILIGIIIREIYVEKYENLLKGKYELDRRNE